MEVKTTTGKVKWFDKTRKFGFLQDDLGDDYFVHLNDLACHPNLEAGEKVSFEMAESEKGPYAKNVKLIEE